MKVLPTIRRQLIAELVTPTARDVAHNPTVGLVNFTVDNIGRIAEFRPLVLDAQSAYLARGCLGVFAVVEDRCVGYAWATYFPTGAGAVNGYLKLYSGDALIHDCRVGEGARGRGVYVAMLRHLCQRLTEEVGPERIVVDTDWRNIASLRGILRAGFSIRHSGIYVTFGHLLVYRSQTFKPTAIK
jgi:hypothetical protein